MGTAFFPLDEALELLPGPWSPRLAEAVVRLGVLLPFEQVPEHLAFFMGVRLSRETARRLTEQAGAQLVAVEEQDLATLEATLPAPPPGPPVQQLSADGAMVPLVGGAWGEVKLLTIGTVTTTPDAAGQPQPHTTALSYLARLTDADTFGRLSTLETHRRGTATAGTVAAVMDGAVWLQHLIDLQRPDAVRILDFPHAAEHLAAAAHAVWGEGSATARCWLDGWRSDLKTADPADVLAAVAVLPTAQAADPVAAARVITQTLEYLAARWDQLQYAQFRAAGLPIGSGCVESGHKLVMQARLKGQGMHWAPTNVNPLLALRCALLNDRWTERWERLTVRWRATVRRVRRARRMARRPPPPVAPIPAPPRASTAAAPLPPLAAPLTTPPRPKTIVNGRPTAAHPWKRHARLPRSGAPAPAKR